MTPIPDVPWSRVAGFVRQHTHDLRNDLNGLDLEATLLGEIVTDPEARESVIRMRGEIRRIASRLRATSADFAEPRLIPVRLPARDLFQIWQECATELGGLDIEWSSTLGSEAVDADPAALATALRQVLANAKAFPASGRIRATAGAANGQVNFTLHEPKSAPVDPSRWGQSPLETTRRGAYGLGLTSLLRVIEGHGGSVTWQFSAAEGALITTITLPII